MFTLYIAALLSPLDKSIFLDNRMCEIYFFHTHKHSTITQRTQDDPGNVERQVIYKPIHGYLLFLLWSLSLQYDHVPNAWENLRVGKYFLNLTIIWNSASLSTTRTESLVYISVELIHKSENTVVLFHIQQNNNVKPIWYLHNNATKRFHRISFGIRYILSKT